MQKCCVFLWVTLLSQPQKGKRLTRWIRGYLTGSDIKRCAAPPICSFSSPPLLQPPPYSAYLFVFPSTPALPPAATLPSLTIHPPSPARPSLRPSIHPARRASGQLSNHPSLQPSISIFGCTWWMLRPCLGKTSHLKDTGRDRSFIKPHLSNTHTHTHAGQIRCHQVLKSLSFSFAVKIR